MKPKLRSETAGGLSRRSLLYALGAGAVFVLTGCGPTPDDVRFANLSATATAASGKQLTNEGFSKFPPEVVRTLAGSVGILLVHAADVNSGEGASGTAWLVKHNGSRVVTAGHVVLSQRNDVDPATASLVTFVQPIHPAQPPRVFKGPFPQRFAVPRAYRESVTNGNPNPAHDLGVFTLDAATEPPMALRYDPDYVPQPGEQLLTLSYPGELIGVHPGTNNVDPKRTVMSAALATVISVNGGMVFANLEVDKGSSGGVAIAECGGEFLAVGVITMKEPENAHQGDITLLRDLPELL